MRSQTFANVVKSRQFRSKHVGLLSRFAIVILAGLIASGSYIASSAVSSGGSTTSVSTGVSASPSSAIDWLLRSTATGRYASLFTPPVASVSVGTFAADCTTPKVSFNLGDVVCVSVTGAPLSGARVFISDPDNFLRSAFDVTSSSQTFLFTVPASSSTGGFDNRGTWTATIVDGDASRLSLASFLVHDTSQLVADLTVSKTLASDVTAGSNISYLIYVTNQGPDPAADVQLTDFTPSNTTFVSFTQNTGLAFNCTTTAGTTLCTKASMAVGETASFTAVYNLSDSIGNGADLTATASITGSTFDSHDGSNNAVAVTSASNPSPPACTITCPDNITAAADTTENGQLGTHVTFPDATTSGTCGTVTSTPSSGSFFPVGTNIVSVSETGGASCSFTITVTEGAALTITCPSNKEVNDDAQHCEVAVNVGTPTTTGDNVTVTSSRSDGRPLTDPYPPGVTTITWTASNSSGTQSCQQTVTVHDVVPPTITCPANITTATDPGSCSATVDPGTATATDNCDNAVVTGERSDGLALTAAYPKGTTTITWTATDGVNSVTCAQTVTVNDTENPTISCPANITVNNDPGTCGATVTYTAPVGTDNCAGATTAQTAGLASGSTFPGGTTTNTFEVTDGSGNKSSCSFTVTVNDTEKPTITAPPNVTANTGSGATSCDTVVSDATLGTASAHDNCPGVTVSRSPSGNTFPVGTTTVTWTATDAHGNTATATQTVTVIDNTPPVVRPPANVTANTGPGATSCGTVVSDATLGTASATDNCPGVSGVTRTGVPSGNVFPVGTTTLTYSATDAHGNSSSATQTVTVIDNTPPVISCPSNITLEPTCPSGAIATYTAPVATDNCPGVTTTRTAGLASGSVFPIGTTTVTYTANDAHGNSTSCSFTVTVKTAAQTIQDIITTVQALQPPLTGTQVQGLQAKLQAALDAINQGKTNVACNKLSDFNSQVTGFIANGTLTSAQGQPLINSSNHVRNTIGCTNNPCT